MSEFIDTSQLGVLALDLAKAGRVAAGKVGPIVHRGANNIKRDWRSAWKGLSYAPALPYSISYDFSVRPWGAGAIIGPDKNKPQGPLGNLIEFGSVNNGPHPGGMPALLREAPKAEKALAEMASKIL